MSDEKRNVSIELTKTGGPYGDETSSYDVAFSPSNLTVRELLEYVVENSKRGSESNGWWGVFRYQPSSGGSSEAFMEYADCKVLYPRIFYGPQKDHREKCDKIFCKIRNARVKEIKAHGGWGSMDYTIWVED